MQCREILVVEPDPVSQKLLEERLRARHYRVTLVDDGKAALEHLISERLPDVILLELDLPKMSGWRFLEIQKTTPSIASIPTLVFSKGKKHAANFPDRYWRKDARFEELFEALDRLCAANSRKTPRRSLPKGSSLFDPPKPMGQLELEMPARRSSSAK
jgi:CheY-like chemotaxis protein